MDVELVALLKEFASSNRYQLWFKVENFHSLPPSLPPSLITIFS